ncbi:hypothetical protein BG000_004406, partial [Podila horticola]
DSVSVVIGLLLDENRHTRDHVSISTVFTGISACAQCIPNISTLQMPSQHCPARTPSPEAPPAQGATQSTFFCLSKLLKGYW